MDRIKYMAKMRMRRKRALYKIQEKDNIQNTDCQEEVEDEEENRIEMEIEQQDDADISNEDEMEIEQQREEDEMIEKNNVEIEVHNEQEFYLESEKEDEINDETTSDDEIEDDVEVKEIMELRAWAIQNNIPHIVLDALLKILRNRLLPTLPISAKTFLRTNSVRFNIEQFPLSRGQTTAEFVYFSIAEGLRKCINVKLHANNTLNLIFGIDGTSPYKSSALQLWPIMCKVQFEPDLYEPFPVAIYAGDKKPNDLKLYLQKFIEEINELQTNNIVLENQIFKINVMCFVCDRPARSFIKGIKGHGGYYACERCVVRGKRVALHETKCSNKTMIYPEIDCAERTDLSFRLEENPEHHICKTPLITIPTIDMIFHFVLDFMHLCCLGVMKKLLLDYWIQSNSNVKLGVQGRLEISRRLLALQSQIPVEFQRTTRSLVDILKWKATEFRFFLLYSGPVILKGILPKLLYRHFLLFHAACRILCSKELALKYNAKAKTYLRIFVLTARNFYGSASQILNMHNLIHLADDAKNLSCSLSEITAFPFENAIKKIKQKIRSGKHPLAQLCHRYSELWSIDSVKKNPPPTITIEKFGRILSSGDVLVKKLKWKNVVLSTKEPNNTILLHNDKVVKITDMYIPSMKEINDIIIVGRLMKIKSSMYAYPFSSKKLKQWEIVDNEERSKKITCGLHKIKSKMVRLDVLVSSVTGEKNHTLCHFFIYKKLYKIIVKIKKIYI
ncbi:uncharacterized protein [Linepithema humile]|uniref:uncharacterized protein n=1 Tax=Linepithema humile TaxID=83485 RepID=UPI00351EDFA7